MNTTRLSDHFKTPKGTELPILNLKGKPYLQVAHRIVWFREDHPFGRIETEPFEITADYAIFKATIFILDKNGAYQKVSDGYKKEDQKHFSDYIEKSCTGAVGRALALVGYGTQFAPDIDEEHRIVDTPIAPAKAAIAKQGTIDKFKISEARLKRMHAISKNSGWSSDQCKSLLQTYGYQSSKDVQVKDYESICEILEGSPPRFPFEETKTTNQ